MPCLHERRPRRDNCVESTVISVIVYYTVLQTYCECASIQGLIYVLPVQACFSHAGSVALGMEMPFGYLLDSSLCLE